MFTGIIEDVGTVMKRSSSVLSVKTSLTDMKQGDSISVNGICLTITTTSSHKRTFVMSRRPVQRAR